MLETKVQAKNAYAAKVKANAITRVIPDIYDHYQVTVPTDLGRLDYLEREILLNVEKGDWTAARNTAAEVLRVWIGLTPTFVFSVSQHITYIFPSIKKRLTSSS